MKVSDTVRGAGSLGCASVLASVQRRLADSNCCKRLCRPLPNHSAKAPGGRIRSRGRWLRLNGPIQSLTVSLQERSATDRVQEARERYVARGVSTPPLVVERAEGARVWDVDGREYIDFAGGLGCANLGHNLPAVVDAVHDAGRPLPAPVLHGRDVRAVRRGLPPARRALAVPRREPEVDPPELGRRGDRERRQDRARRDRAARGDRLRQRLPRPHAARDDDDVEGRPVQAGLRAVRARGLPHARALSVPRHHRGRRDRGAEAPLQGRRRPAVGRVRRARAGAGRGRLHPDDARLPEAPPGAARPARDPLRERRGAVRLRPHRAGLGDRALRASSPTCSSPARRSAAGCRSPASPAARRSWTPSRPAGSAARSAATRSRAPRRSRSSTRSRANGRAPSRSARASANGSTRWRRRAPRCAASARWSRSSCPSRRGEETSRITREAREQGLLLLSCGIYGNVIRILVPFTIGDEELDKGLDILEGLVRGS